MAVQGVLEKFQKVFFSNLAIDIRELEQHMKRVWHITTTLHGGAGIYAQRLSDALQGAGVDSCVLTADPDRVGDFRSHASVVSQFATRGLKSMCHRLTNAPFYSLLSPDVWIGSSMPISGDIIHLHGLTGWIGLRGLKALIPDGTRVFWTTHDLWPLSGGCILYSGCDGYRHSCGKCPILKTGAKSWARAELKMKEYFIKEKKVCPVANSEWMAGHIKSSRVFRGTKEVAVIPPIIDTAYFAGDIKDIKGELGIPLGKRVVCLGARAVTDRYKGIPEFLEALATRDGLAEQCVVLLFGEGEIKTPSGLDVRSMGRLNSASEIAQVYHSSDVFVSPSVMETFGMALAEAQACGTPVAAFDVGGVRDAICDECKEFIVPARDYSGLLDAIEKVFKKATEADQKWRVSRDWARGSLAGSVVAAKQLKIYNLGHVKNDDA